MRKSGKLIMASLAVVGAALAGGVIYTGLEVSKQNEKNFEFRVHNNSVQWTENGKLWNDLIEVEELKGEDAFVWTIGEDGFWYKDGVQTDKVAVSNGIVSIEPNEEKSTKAITVYDIVMLNGDVFSIEVKNGQDSSSVVTIDEEGYWCIDGERTEYKAEGKDGDDGVGIRSFDIVEEDETKTVYEITYTDDTKFTFTVKHGTNGTDGTDGIDGEDALAPTVEIKDGWWYINGINTNVKAEGKDGKDAKQYTIEDDGYWYVDGVKTEYKALGEDGVDGVTIISVEEDKSASSEEETVYIMKYSDGSEFPFSVKNGVDGEEGTAPKLEIKDGWWYINDVKTAPAQGEKGEDGRGIVSIKKDESASSETQTVYIVTYTDNTTSELTVKNGTDGSNGSEITIDAEGYLCIDGVRTTINQKDEIGSVVTVQGGYLYIDGVKTEIKVRQEYKVTYDYVYGDKMKAQFDNMVDSVDIEPTQWLTNMPIPKADCRGDFEGWFIQGTNRKVSNYDFVGGDVTLEARWNYLPSGYYQDGLYNKTWQELNEEFSCIYSNEMWLSTGEESPFKDLTGIIVIDDTIQRIGGGLFKGVSLSGVHWPQHSIYFSHRGILDIFDLHLLNTTAADGGDGDDMYYLGNVKNPYYYLVGSNEKCDYYNVHPETKEISASAYFGVVKGFSLPNGLEKIGTLPSLLQGYFVIPSSVTYINPSRIQSNEKIVLSEDNMSYVVIDDALYTIDGKELLYSWKSGTMDLLDSVGEIEERMFADSVTKLCVEDFSKWETQTYDDEIIVVEVYSSGQIKEVTKDGTVVEKEYDTLLEYLKGTYTTWTRVYD